MTNICSSLARVGACLFIALPLPALAQTTPNGTTAGTSITNTVGVTYSVGGVPQGATNASDTFVVDRKVDFTLVEAGNSTTTVAPDQKGAVTTFTLTNLANAPLDFALGVGQQTTGSTVAHGSTTDGFDLTAAPLIYRDNPSSGTVGQWDAGDALVTYVDELAAGASVTLFVRGDIPASVTNGQVAGVRLTSTAGQAGTAGTQGTVILETPAGSETNAAMDTVFASAVRVAATPSGFKGELSSLDDYTVAAALLSVVKRSRVISDSIRGTNNPLFIPNALVEYCIAVSNASGGATATNVTISDNVPSQLTIEAGTLRLNGTVDAATGVCSGGATGGTVTGSQVTGTLSDIPGGTTRALIFRARVN